MNKTKIEWCDWTWNPIVGCSPVSEGCANCYAERIAARYHYRWDGPSYYPERLKQPAWQKKPGRVFVCSMSDFWHPGVQPEWRAEILDAMAAAPQHTYLLLTKRPENARRFCGSRNLWLGITGENQRRADERWDCLAGIGAAVRFVSVEPMLGPVTLRDWATLPDWVIAGPETGPGARPCNPEWIVALARECEESNTPFFDKRKAGYLRREWPKAGGVVGMVPDGQPQATDPAVSATPSCEKKGEEKR
jgi:protein gp37